jgi:hypothetical protein
MEKKTTDLLLSKLRRPIHITYISKYILKESEEKTREILNQLISDGLIKKSPIGEDYYGIN